MGRNLELKNLNKNQGFVLFLVNLFIFIISILVIANYNQVFMQFKMIALFKKSEIHYKKLLKALKQDELAKANLAFSGHLKVEEVYKRNCVELPDGAKGTIIVEKITEFEAHNLDKNPIVLQAYWAKTEPDSYVCKARIKALFTLGQQSLTELNNLY